MIVTADVAELRQHTGAARAAGRSIGCVPTMGALHRGHTSLMRASCERCDFHVVTIFVNPTQFAPTEDLARYPRPVEQDLDACRQAGMDLVYMPEIPTLYPPGYSTWVTVEGLTDVLEGASRPGHFRGVTTIVMKLFHLVQPDVAFFGAKDYQQQTVIRKMVRELDVPVEIVVCPTVREPDGLALSSRNVYLNPAERAAARSLSESLRLAERRLKQGEADIAAIEQAMRGHMQSQPLVQVDYAVIADADSLERLTEPRSRMAALAAAKVGSTRLIDNLPISL